MDSRPILGDRVGFGLFEANLSERKLYHRGVLIHIQDKPFQILATLLERAGEVVTREELQKKLWAGDTFVDFDEGLNTAIRKLRYALGDSHDNPTFIETIPRQGYRLIVSVRTLNETTDQEHTPSHVRVFNHLVGQKELDSDQAPRQEKQDQKVVALPGSAQKRRKQLACAAAVLVVLGIGFSLDYFRHTGQWRSPMHFAVPLPGAIRDLALSHDGSVLAFVAPLPQRGGTALWTLDVGGFSARELANTESASYPFWSPDGQFIAFFSDGKLKKVGRAGGPVQVICDAPIGRGGTWSHLGVIVFAGDTGVGMRRVSAAGGPVMMVPGFEQKVPTTTSYRWPVFLPDGKHFLYTSVDFGADLRGEAN